MLEINIKTVDHKFQNYNTVGSYWDDNSQRNILVSDLNNWKFEFLIALHEMVEQALCIERKINLEKSVAFDKDFQKSRTKEMPAEPGDQKNAPYHKEHTFASEVEKRMAAELGVDWNEYNKVIDRFYSKSIADKTFG